MQAACRGLGCQQYWLLLRKQQLLHQKAVEVSMHARQCKSIQLVASLFSGTAVASSLKHHLLCTPSLCSCSRSLCVRSVLNRRCSAHLVVLAVSMRCARLLVAAASVGQCTPCGHMEAPAGNVRAWWLWQPHWEEGALPGAPLSQQWRPTWVVRALRSSLVHTDGVARHRPLSRQITAIILSTIGWQTHNPP